MVKPKGLVVISIDRCKGCELCTEACPVGILFIDGAILNIKGYFPAAVSDMDKCIGCGNCAVVCPDVAISVERSDN